MFLLFTPTCMLKKMHFQSKLVIFHKNCWIRLGKVCIHTLSVIVWVYSFLDYLVEHGVSKKLPGLKSACRTLIWTRLLKNVNIFCKYQIDKIYYISFYGSE